MAFANLTGAAYFPRMPLTAGNAPNLATTGTLDAAGEAVALACEAPKSGNIAKIICRTVTSAGTGTGTLTARLKEIVRSATPATPHATNLSHTNATGDQSITSTSDDTTFTIALTASAAVTKGDRLMVELSLTNIGTSVTTQLAGFIDDRGAGYPYALINTSGSWALTTNNILPVVGFEYDDGSYEPVVGNSTGGLITASTFNSSSTPDTYAQRFQFTFPARVTGFWLWCDLDSDTTVRLVTSAYNQGAGTGIVASKTLLATDRSSDTQLNIETLFPDFAELDANTNYRLVIEPGAGGITIYDADFASLAAMGGDDGGSAFHLSTAKDPTGDGDWTNFNSGTFRQLYCGLLLKGFSDGAGGAGGVMTLGGMTGGNQRT